MKNRGMPVPTKAVTAPISSSPRRRCSKRIGLSLGLLIRRAFWQPKVRKNFRPVRGREKLLRDEEKASARQGKCRDGRCNDGLPPPNRPGDRGAKHAIARRVINIAMTALRRWPVLEEREPKPGRKVDRGEPRDDERDAGHPEQSLHIFARRAGREANRDESQRP